MAPIQPSLSCASESNIIYTNALLSRSYTFAHTSSGTTPRGKILASFAQAPYFGAPVLRAGLCGYGSVIGFLANFTQGQNLFAVLFEESSKQGERFFAGSLLSRFPCGPAEFRRAVETSQDYVLKCSFRAAQQIRHWYFVPVQGFLRMMRGAALSSRPASSIE